MVAIRGTGWRLAPALVLLMNETDRLFPNRRKASDGSIGDTAHSARTSDHNPDSGWVDAVDITDDDANGCDVGLLAHHLVASRDARVSYLIHKGTIWRGYAKPGLPAFTPQTYTGYNAHKLHLHVSLADAHRYSTRPWWPQSKPKPIPPPLPPLEENEDDMPYKTIEITDGTHKGKVFMLTPQGPVHVISSDELATLRTGNIVDKAAPVKVHAKQLGKWFDTIGGNP